MGLQASPVNILTNRITNVVLRSDRGNWTIGNPGSPVFTVAGAVGDTLADQVILDRYTAVVGVQSSQANAPITITDSKNNDAVSLSVWGASQFSSAGRQVTDDLSKIPDGKHNQSTRDQIPVRTGQH